MNILFGSNTSRCNLGDTHLSNNDIAHYIELTYQVYYTNIKNILDKKLLKDISHHKCNNIVYNHNKNGKSHFILKFVNLEHLFEFATSVSQYADILSIKIISNEYYNQNIDNSDSSDDTDDTDNMNDIEDDINKCLINSVLNKDEDTNSENSENISTDSAYENCDTLSFYENDDIDNKIKTLYSVKKDIDSPEQYISHEFKDKITSIVGQIPSREEMVKYQSILETKYTYFQSIVNNNATKIITTTIPKKPKCHPFELHDPCHVYYESDDDDDNNESEGELEFSLVENDKWHFDLSSETSSVLSWLDINSTEKSTYTLSIDGKSILSFNKKEKGEKYMKHLTLMILRKAEVAEDSSYFKIEKTLNGYIIFKCIWIFFLPMYIKYHKVELWPVYEP